MPIVSIGNLISFIVSSLITLRLYFSYRQTKNKRVNDFFKAFLFLSIFFGLLATPELLFKNPKIIELVSLEISFFFVYLSVAYLVKVALGILNWKKLEKIYFWGLIIFATVITIINISTVQPAIYHSQGQFIFWEDNRNIVISTITGLVVSFGTISGVLFFFIGGLKAAGKYIRTRSFIIAGGLLLMALASLINYIWGASPQIFLTSIIASLVAIAGLLTLLKGIYYKSKISS